MRPELLMGYRIRLERCNDVIVECGKAMSGKHDWMEVVLGCNRFVVFIGPNQTIYVMVTGTKGKLACALGTPPGVVRELFSVLGLRIFGVRG